MYSRAAGGRAAGGGRWAAGGRPWRPRHQRRPSEAQERPSEAQERPSGAQERPSGAQERPSRAQRFFSKCCCNSPTYLPILGLNIGYLNGGIVRAELARWKYANDPSIERFQVFLSFFTKKPSFAPGEFRPCFIKELNGDW